MTTIAVSSFSLFTVLGPLHMESRSEDGALLEFEVPLPQEHTLEEFIALAKSRLGVDAVELCQIQFDSTDDARLDSIKAALDSNDVRLLTVPIDTGDLAGGTSEQRAEDVERIQQWIAIAARLGATFVRVNTGSPTNADTQRGSFRARRGAEHPRRHREQSRSAAAHRKPRRTQFRP